MQSLPTRHFDALLFDRDGTILTSLKAAERIWTAWAEQHGLDVATFLPTIHGIQAVETVRRQALPGIDAEAEAAKITLAEIADVDGVDALPGANAFLRGLPKDRWAIVTSAPRALALRRIAAAGLPVPELLITADDVERSKPAPDGFLQAAEALGTRAEECLVLEDSAAGIAAAEAAGTSVLVVTGAQVHPVPTSHPSVPDYEALRVTQQSSGRLVLNATRA